MVGQMGKIDLIEAKSFFFQKKDETLDLLAETYLQRCSIAKNRNASNFGEPLSQKLHLNFANE